LYLTREKAAVLQILRAAAATRCEFGANKRPASGFPDGGPFLFLIAGAGFRAIYRRAAPPAGALHGHEARIFVSGTTPAARLSRRARCFVPLFGFLTGGR